MMKRHYPTALGLLALMTLGGCASIDDCCYEKTQTARAITEYLKCGNPECSCYPHDYKCGWIDGFYEVATGGESCPPAVAPARYYKPEQILEHCDKKRHAYYSGWQDGASRASQFPDTHYLRIYETCECPFPRCDKPCGDNACGPCGITFAGMSASDDMIETMPVADAYEAEDYSGEIVHNNVAIPFIPAEELSVQSSSNREVESAPIAEKTKAAVDVVEEQVPAPTPDTGASFADGFEFSETSASMTDGFSLNPVLPLKAEPKTRTFGQPIEGKAVGFIRLVQPIQDAAAPLSASTMKSSEQVSPVAIVEAAESAFEMLDTATDQESAR